ncbi:MAG: HAD family hydrolase [Flavobacteriales bacterium]
MISLNGIRNVIFDFGGVLFEIDYDLPAQAFEKLGFAGFRDLYTQAAQNPIFDLLETGKVSNQEFLSFLHEQVPSASRQQVLDAWNVILLHILPEEVRFVNELRQSGTRTFLLSNTNAIHVEEFEQMIARTMDIAMFRNAFEQIYYSNVIGLKKPHPETFLAVCEWNSLNPAETLFIDDSKQHVEGALRAGLHAYHLQPGERVSEILTLS